MTEEQIRHVQRRLTALGFNPGPVDGVLGRKTIAAVASFQKAQSVPVQWPGTIGPMTLAALELPALAANGKQSIPWFDEVKRRMGLHEIRNNGTLRAWLRLDGKTLGDPARLPWCGDLVQTALALTLPKEVLPTNPYLARNWAGFGKACVPQVGAVAVFWRGAYKGWSGHVGFIAGRKAGHLYILGGNQSNRISIAPLSTDRLLSTRWPITYVERGITPPLMRGGAVSTNEA